ncbi:hypothetical protein EV401DRAFT_696624 [Pisolithus croceorrhizus]|nr:hypothetical protein EV401DRAFT_696624 [Pisolithus croceorrhizus]
MLGSGEALYTSQCRSEELVGGTHLITFSQGESATSAPGPSLLITLGQRYSDHVVVASGGDDSNPMSEASSVLVHETDLGQTALLRYYKQYHIEDIQEAVQYFENAYAQHECPLNYPYRAAVLVNLAEAKFMRCRTDPTSANLEDSISLYRRALELRRPGHPDRPATVLQLAQALLFRYEKQGCNEADADEVNKLMSASHVFSEDSYERQAADLVLETLERCRTVNSGSLAELDTLVRKLELGAKVPSNGYFNAPQRLINLSTALWRRYEERGELSDLNRSSEISKQALQLLHCRDPDRLSGLKTLHSVLWRLFEIHADFSYLGELIGIKEEALQLMPEGHPERLYWVTNLNSHRAKMLESLGDKAFVTRKYDEAIAFYSRAIVVLQSSTS